MRTCTRHIPTELITADRSTISAWIKSRLSGAILHGYGYYGVSSMPYLKDGEWVVDFHIGGSCD